MKTPRGKTLSLVICPWWRKTWEIPVGWENRYAACLDLDGTRKCTLRSGQDLGEECICYTSLAVVSDVDIYHQMLNSFLFTLVFRHMASPFCSDPSTSTVAALEKRCRCRHGDTAGPCSGFSAASRRTTICITKPNCTHCFKLE